MYPDDKESLCVDDPEYSPVRAPAGREGPSQNALIRQKYEDWWVAAWEDHINMYGDHTLR